MIVNISKRKLESYKKAELVARETRFLIASNNKYVTSKLGDLILDWMKVTGKIKYKRP